MATRRRGWGAAFVTLAAVLACAGLAAADSFELRVPVGFPDGVTADMIARDGEDLVQVALAFAAAHNVAQDDVGPLIASLEAESQRLHALQPLAKVDVEVNGVQRIFTLYPGQEPAAAVDTFLRELAVTDSPTAARDLLAEVRKQLNLKATADAAAARAAATTTPLARVPVDLGDGNTVVLERLPGQTVAAAVAAFAAKYDVTAPADLAQLEASLGSVGARTLLTQAIVNLDNVDYSIDVHHGDSAEGLAREFVVAHGLKDTPDFAVYVDKVTQIINDYVRAAAPKAQASEDGNRVAIIIKLGDEALELSVDRYGNARRAAESFCTDYWDAMFARLQRLLGLTEANKSSISPKDCVNILEPAIAKEIEAVNAQSG